MGTRVRRRVIVPAAIVVAGAVTAGVILSDGGDGDEASAAGATTATTTAPVEARDLIVTDAYDGTLGYGDAREFASERAGVVTTIAAVGSSVAPGGALFSVDMEPTVVLTGAVPAYRALDISSPDGPDVAQLEQALVTLGFGAGLTVDQTFDGDTADAVEEWETALGRSDPDGDVEPGDIVFADGALRVESITSDVGTRVQSGTTVVAATPPAHVVTVELEVSRSDEIEPGTAVQLTMPGGAETTGTVLEIGTEATEDDAAGAAPGEEPTVPMTIALDDAAAAAGFDTGSVDVAVERSREEDATAVPVTALLALAEGGYALQVVDAGGYRLVAVDVGTYAEGYVGVTGEGIESGVEVVVPA